jgi:2',3'-cyclic-nucleotide 2'-phosphodiesterase
MRILFVADVFGEAGWRALEDGLRRVRDEHRIDFCAVNAENAADGAGLTPRIADRLLASGADVLTLGNHAWRRRELLPYLNGADRVARPANFTQDAPGRAVVVAPAADGTPVAVIALLGLLFLDVPVGPFALVDALVDEARALAAVVIVDFHAEATSEKIALARWLDGRVTAVVGTHTHVQTADARVQPGGTAAISDAGMTGPHDSVIGVRAELAIARMRTGLPVRFEPADADIRIEGVVVECDADGRALSCEPLRLHVG